MCLLTSFKKINTKQKKKKVVKNSSYSAIISMGTNRVSAVKFVVVQENLNFLISRTGNFWYFVAINLVAINLKSIALQVMVNLKFKNLNSFTKPTLFNVTSVVSN